MIYLDNAATTFPKPECVVSEIKKCITEYCGNPGRSGHILSLRAAEKVFACREALSSFFGSSKPENVIFTLNTTYAINLAIEMFYEPGAHVLISNMEHNSVFRPIVKLQKNEKISYSIFNVLQPTTLILQEINNKIRPDTKLLVMLHASNICGRSFPIREIGKLCKEKKITFIVDAAQSAGKIPIHIEDDHIDALCAPAHKGLYGPQGVGFVLLGKKLPVRNFIAGGNGVDSLSADMGTYIPESFEAGTLPTPAIAGLHAAIQWLERIGIQTIQQKEMHLTEALKERLLSIPNGFLYQEDQFSNGILLYNDKRFTSAALSNILNKANICTRSGFHCAPLAHATLGTGNSGALRISTGYFNSLKEIDTIYNVLRKANN